MGLSRVVQLTIGRAVRVQGETLWCHKGTAKFSAKFEYTSGQHRALTGLMKTLPWPEVSCTAYGSQCQSSSQTPAARFPVALTATWSSHQVQSRCVCVGGRGKDDLGVSLP